MAKYDKSRKIERNQMLLDYRRSHPEMSLAEIGKIFNISPQRVWELLKIAEVSENNSAR